MNSTPFWKKVHQTVSGYSHNITEEIVKEILNLSRSELLEGLLAYKPYTKKGYDDWISTSDSNNCMKEFIHDLSQELNLDVKIAYSIMCNYLMFEYHGKIKEFWQVTRIGTTIYLKESIWNFYTSERMFLLKTWRHIFEFIDQDYEFSEQYRDFVKTLKLEELQNNLIKQFNILISEISSKSLDDKYHYSNNWLCRNLREQNEILLILTLTLNHQTLKTTQFTQLVSLFIQNNFSTTPPVYELRGYSKGRDLEELMFAEIGCFFVALESYWDKDLNEFWKTTSVKELDDCILGLHLNPGQTLIVLSWYILKFKTLYYEGYVMNILELSCRDPFILLHSLISSNIFKNCYVGEVVLKSVHKMMDELCLMYDDRKMLYEQNGVIGTITEFLKRPELSKIILQTRNGLDSLLEIAIETFPYDFMSFTQISKSLLGQQNQYKQTLQLLTNIPWFLSEMTWSSPQEEISKLTNSQPAFPDSDLIVFPPNTAVKSYAIFGKNLIQYRGSYSYFLYLEYLVNLLINNGLARRKFDEELVQKVVAGYELVIQGVKYCVDMDLKMIGLERVILKLNKLLVHLDGLLLHSELIKLYFKVQNAMMTHRQTTFFDICPEIVWKVFFPKLKADYIDNDVSNLLFNQYMFEDTIFVKMFQEEEFKEDHSLLIIYIKILHNIIQVKLEFNNFQLSGISYLFNFVFLQHQSWNYKDDNQKTEVTLGCLNIFHCILQREVEELNESEQKIFYLCQHAFLNNVYIIESFLKLFVKEKHYLLFLMERESNWIDGPSLAKLKCIRMQLALLLLIMKQKMSYGKCPLDERLQYVVKPVASYFTNSYSPVVAELSCRFLEKLAQDEQIPLLALLELDHYQVQSLFLEKLRDPLEEESVKIAIIDLINTCISNQNGMTAAFFNLKCFMYWDGTENDVFTGDSVSDFMVDYLQNIKTSHEYFKNPLQLGILRLLFNLWSNHRESLIENIAKLEDFWPIMTDPFLSDYIQDPEIYTIILKIINLEFGAHKATGVEAKLTNTINNFLKDKQRIQNWSKFVLELSQKVSKNNFDLLSAWIEFLVLAKKVMGNSFSDEVKTILIGSCLDGINIPEGGFNNIEYISLWAQLYLMLTTSWSIPENQQKGVVDKLIKFLTTLSSYYKYLSPKIKEINLCIVNRAVIDFQKYFATNTVILMTFLYSVGILIDLEYESLHSQVWSVQDELEKSIKLKPWLIVISIGNSIINLDNLNEVAIWFRYRFFLQRVLESVCPMLQQPSTLPYAKLAINFMINYAESSLVKDFLHVDLFTFYYKLRAPSLTISAGEAITVGMPEHLKEWWLIFITLTKLNRILMDKIGDGIFSTCFSFITQNDELFKEIICLTKYTVDMTALTLVCETLKLVYIVLQSMPHWCIEHSNSYNLVLTGVKTTMNACVLSILGYKKINFYSISRTKRLDLINCAPTDLLVSVLNKLTEVVYWSSSCMRKTKPDPIAHLDSQDLMEHMNLFIDADFSVPRFELPITSKLTYGILLCLADYLCKTLNQLSPITPSALPKSREVTLTRLNSEVKAQNLGKVLENWTTTYEKSTGFMVYIQRSDDLPNEKLSSFLHYDMAEFSGITSTISQLDYQMVKNSLESLMSFLACEIFYTIRNLNEETLFAYKRELSSEIQFFYEFVRKRTSEQYNAIVATPRSSTSSSISLSQNETDIINRYVLTKVNDGDVNDIADNNFVLVISQWLMKFCHLSN